MTESRRETALITAVPDGEPVVGRWRRRHDTSAAAGVPPHITLLYPFAPPERIDPAMLAGLHALFATLPPVHLTLAGICAFPNVLYLAPEPAAPFDRMIAALRARYPELPPYGGTIADPIPHLTVADTSDRAAFDSVVDDFVAEAASALPVRCVVRDIRLIAQDVAGRWQPLSTFALSG